MHAAPEVYGVGQCCLDCVGVSDSYPAQDAKCELQALYHDGGGPTATALVALATWGRRCRFDGVVGDDAAGEDIRAGLDRQGVDVHGLRVRRGACSQFAFIHAEPGRGHRTIFWRRATGEPLRPDELDDAALCGARMLYTDGLQIEAALAAAARARAAGVPVFVDAGSLRDGMLELAALADSFVVGEPFSRALSGGDHRVTCRLLQARGARRTGVTLGVDGYLVLEGDTWIEGRAYRVDAVDTTGCGDVFHAGLAYGDLLGWPVRRSLDFAAWAASRVSLAPGGRRGIPSAEDYPG